MFGAALALGLAVGLGPATVFAQPAKQGPVQQGAAKKGAAADGSAAKAQQVRGVPPAAGDSGASGSEILIKVGTVAPDGTPWSELVEGMRERFRKASGERLRLRPYWGGRLGGEKEMVRETRAGRIQMYGGSTASLATMVPDLYILEAPYLFESDAEADFVLDGYARAHVRRLLDRQGFVFYQFSENGWHGLAMKGDCIQSAADLRGKKVRSQEAAIHLDTFKALGANPVEIAVPEVLPALQQGVVDGFSNTPLFSFATSWYQGVRSFTVTDHIYQPGVIVYSKRWFATVPKDLQGILLSNVEEDEKFGREGVRGIKAGLLENFASSRIQVCEADAALKAELAKATAGVFARYRQKASKDGKALADALLEGKKAWRARKKP